MRCGACGAENPAAAKFCIECGAGLQRRCASCGTPAPSTEARFCMECGSAFEDAVAATAPPAGAPVAERRLCSVLFVDLVGFTPFSEGRDAEEVREVLSRYFEVARRVIGRYGGTVEKFIGDAVMAVWGAPTAGEGDTERSVRAALELVDAIQVLGEEVGAEGLRARAGVVTGEVAVTLGATSEGMVAGDVVNTAARVQSAASPGSVLVDEPTRRLCEPAIAFAEAGEFELKGKLEPQALFTAVRVVSGVGGVQWAVGLDAPFVGRDAELRSVKDLFQTCVERRAPRLVVVTGPPGVGKSRIGWEFQSYIDGLVDRVLWHRGRCLSYGEGIAFWALAEIVRQRLAIAEEDASEVAATKLRDGLAGLIAEEADRVYVGVRLGRLLGADYPAPAPVSLSPEELFAGWRLFFEALARTEPVVLLIDDAQHADASLLGFLDHLVDWSRDLPIFVLVLARPGNESIDAGWGVGRNRSSLSLDPLDPGSVDRLVDGMVPGMPAHARASVVERAEGIPLFAVETIRSLIDRQIVEKTDGGSYRLVGELTDLTVPDSLHGLLAARLDSLPPELRSLVGDASVLGASFPAAALVAVSGQDEAVVTAALTELVRRDVLEVIADPLSPERGSYRFAQELLRQVAYDTLSRRDRKTRHLAVAAHLRTTFANDGEEIADAIARHYLDALAAVTDDPDAAELRSNALGFLARAAKRAAQSGAPARAAELSRRAAEIAPPDRAGELWEQAADASYDAGRYEAAVDWAGAARDAHDAAGNERGAARARTIEGQAFRRLGRLEAARAALSEALEVLREPADLDTLKVLSRFSGLEAFAGNPVRGRELATEGLRLADALGAPPGEVAGLFNSAGLNAGFAGDLSEATALLREAVRLAEQAADEGLLGLVRLNLSDLLARSDPHAAADCAREAAEGLRRSGQSDSLAVALINRAEALMQVGQWHEASEIFVEAREIDLLEWPFSVAVRASYDAFRGKVPPGDVEVRVAELRVSESAQDQAGIELLDAAAAAAAGDDAEALRHATAAVGVHDAIGIGSESVRWAWPLAARSARKLGDSMAIESLLAALDAHFGHQPPILRAERRLVWALREADAAEELTDAHLAAVADAVEAVRKVGNPYELAHALVDHAELLGRAGRPGAEPLLDEAVAISERLGCPPLAERAAGVRPSAATEAA